MTLRFDAETPSWGDAQAPAEPQPQPQPQPRTGEQSRVIFSKPHILAK